jgi:hypothetical protein
MEAKVAPPPVKTSPPPPPQQEVAALKAQAAAPASSGRFSVAPAQPSAGQRIVLYGTAGVGKTSCAALAPKPLFYDFDRGAGATGAATIGGVETWADLRDSLHSKIAHDYATIVIDTATKVQDLASQHTFATVRHEKGHLVTSVEGYGFGKGYQHVYDTFLALLSDLDEHARNGRNVILVCHCVTDLAPNPDGEDYRRYEPDLQQPPKQGRLRDRVKNWADHLFFINYDVAVNKGKAVGAGTRTIYPVEMPTYWAKSRKLRDPLPFAEGSRDLWNALFGSTK